MTWATLGDEELLAAAAEPPAPSGSASAAAVEDLASHLDRVMDEVRRGEASEVSWCDGAARLLVDALIGEDVEPIVLLQNMIRRAYARIVFEREAATPENRARWLSWQARLEQLSEVARAAQERLLPAAAAMRIEPGSQLERFLIVVGDYPRSSGREIADRMLDRRGQPLAEPVVSRLGQRALGLGLVDVVRTGRRNSWELTPRGRKASERLHVRQGSTLLLYAPDDATPVAAAISNCGEPDQVAVISAHGERVLYVATTDQPDDGSSDRESVDDWTVGAVAAAGPTRAPADIPSEGRVYHKVLACV